MRIKRVNIKNYRSFGKSGGEFVFSDITHPFTIVGANNTGKTNFINAIRHATWNKNSYPNDFDINDFYNKNTSNEIEIEIDFDDPIESAGGPFRQFKEMPMIRFRVKEEQGIVDVSDDFCDRDGNPIYVIQQGKVSDASKSKFTPNQLEEIGTQYKRGAQRVRQYKDKLQVIYIDFPNIEREISTRGYTLLSRHIREIISNFQKDTNVITSGKNKGKSKAKYFNETIKKYFDNEFLQFVEMEQFLENVETFVSATLGITRDNFKLQFNLPELEEILKNLVFYLRDHKNKVLLPLENMGTGYICLFVIGVLQYLSKADEGGKIYLIEEPETYLHEHFQEHFYQILNKLSEKNQVILSTHSKKFVDLFTPESIIKIKNPDYTQAIIIQAKTGLELPDTDSEIGAYPIKNPADFRKYIISIEPNISNIVFANKVIFVEGPDDLLAYKLVLSEEIALGLKNIAVVSVGGKDPIRTLVQLCKNFEISFFVIHDWDLPDKTINVSLDKNKTESVYNELSKVEKAQYTKNHKIIKLCGEKLVHQNKINLEEVLSIKNKGSGSLEIFEKLNGKKMTQVEKEYPGLIDDNLKAFLKN